MIIYPIVAPVAASACYVSIYLFSTTPLGYRVESCLSCVNRSGSTLYLAEVSVVRSSCGMVRPAVVRSCHLAGCQPHKFLEVHRRNIDTVNQLPRFYSYCA